MLYDTSLEFLAQEFSKYLRSSINLFFLAITTTMILVPFVIGALAPNNTASDWQHVFWVVAAVLIITNIIYCIFCSGVPAEWTKPRNHQNIETGKAGTITYASSKLSTIFPEK